MAYIILTIFLTAAIVGALMGIGMEMLEKKYNTILDEEWYVFFRELSIPHILFAVGVWGSIITIINL